MSLNEELKGYIEANKNLIESLNKYLDIESNSHAPVQELDGFIAGFIINLLNPNNLGPSQLYPSIINFIPKVQEQFKVLSEQGITTLEDAQWETLLSTLRSSNETTQTVSSKSGFEEMDDSANFGSGSEDEHYSSSDSGDEVLSKRPKASTTPQDPQQILKQIESNLEQQLVEKKQQL